MDREGGYIKLHRRLKSWPLWQHMTALQRSVVVEILISANWKARDTWIGTVGRGELAQSEETLAREAKVSRKVVRQTIALLVSEGFLARRSGGDRATTGNEKGRPQGRNPTVLTVVNYERYQGGDFTEDQNEGQPRASTGPAEGQPRAPLEEGEEREEGESLLLGAVAPSPAAEIRKPKKAGTDPRFAPLRTAWEAEFQAARGESYRWEGPKDAAGIHRLIAVPIAEFIARARRGLAATGYARCGTLAQLAAKWNDLAGSPAALRSVTAPAQPASAFRGGRVTVPNEV